MHEIGLHNHPVTPKKDTYLGVQRNLKYEAALSIFFHLCLCLREPTSTGFRLSIIVAATFDFLNLFSRFMRPGPGCLLVPPVRILPAFQPTKDVPQYRCAPPSCGPQPIKFTPLSFFQVVPF